MSADNDTKRAADKLSRALAETGRADNHAHAVAPAKIRIAPPLPGDKPASGREVAQAISKSGVKPRRVSHDEYGTLVEI